MEPSNSRGRFHSLRGTLLAETWDKRDALHEARTLKIHSHDRGQLIGATGGLLMVQADGTLWAVPAVHAIWIPPHCKHDVDPHGKFDGWSVWVNKTLCAGLPDRPHTLRVSALLVEAVKRAASWELGTWENERDALVSVIAYEIRRLPEAPLGLPMPSDPRLRKIACALLDNPADWRDQNEWAHGAGLSTRTLSRRFPQETGFGFQQWRQRSRLLKALEYLANDIPVTTVALELGYENISAFIAAFRDLFGVTPGKWRETL
ncbi:helix-turn-helix domain-containing protein [Pseudomonas citronellolis]|uniref:AraC family transcriptional regulator n=1 Tax=Pseudomonas citronellolis TaxID=53408 RepID=UPI00248D81DC|nr:helix-turn-helix transcriptional regulator [Pseudomonas citronellolis]